MKQTKIFDDQYIVITGAAGFIGSGIVKHLNEMGLSNLILVDDLKDSEKWKNLVGKNFADIISKYEIFQWLKGRENEIEAFIHLGACSDTVNIDADYLLENNYRFSVKLAEYAIENEQRFIYASSAATYGDGKEGFNDDEKRIEILRPLNMYAYSKQLFDLWVKRNNLFNKVVGLKYFNIFGPNEYHKGRMASMILKMYEEIKKEGKVKLFNSNDPKYKAGDQVRDFLYVKDAVKMTCALLDDAFLDVCGIFNIGSGKTTSWNDLAKYVFKALGKDPVIEYIDMPKDLCAQYQNYTCADMTKYKNLHKTFSTTNISDAVVEYTQQYLMRNERW